MGHANDIAQRWQDELLETHPQCAAFLCPIRKVLMLDPVTADDGCTYERKAIESWLEADDLSPMKRGGEGERISIGTQLTPNAKMKAAFGRIRGDEEKSQERTPTRWPRSSTTTRGGHFPRTRLKQNAKQDAAASRSCIALHGHSRLLCSAGVPVLGDMWPQG